MNQERLDFVRNLALEAGRLTLEGFGRCGQMAKDGLDEYDIATEYDLRTEELIRSRILAQAGEPILGEEEGLIGDRETAKRSLWIVDPIDGTFNYQRGLPLYGVSIAYCQDGLPLCGAIHLPALDQLFFAAQDRGAFLVQPGSSSPVPIRVAGQEKSMGKLVLGFAGKDSYRLFAACAETGVPRRSLRYLMCAVLDLAYVASGRMDAYLHTGLHLWDCAAGDIILREAGGPALVDFRGTPIFPEYLNRRIDHDAPTRLPTLAVSNRGLIRDHLHGLLASAGFQGQGG